MTCVAMAEDMDLTLEPDSGAAERQDTCPAGCERLLPAPYTEAGDMPAASDGPAAAGEPGASEPDVSGGSGEAASQKRGRQPRPQKPKEDPEVIRESAESLAESLPAQSLRYGRERVEEPRGKLHACNWLADLSDASDCDIVQVQFKNTRVGFYRNSSITDLKIGDVVAVEASPGHDIGTVSMVGRLVRNQMRRANVRNEEELKKVFRRARPADLEKFEEARSREHDTMIRSRKIAEELGLNMKIGDVEYQGDGAKAIFYYIADERVDFRKLIRILADTFRIRIEMKQIGARQEAGRIGGIGPCGRPLCCSSWMNRFVSVGTSAARFQDISMNPQKLAGQCAKLKCCLNFEVDAYMESQRRLPHKDVTLETKDATYYLFKSDILARRLTYSTDRNVAANLVTIDDRRAFEIIDLNKQGIKVDAIDDAPSPKEQPREFVDLVGQDSLTRFDKTKKRKRRRQRPDGEDDNAAEQHRQRREKPAREPRQRAADSVSAEGGRQRQNHRKPEQDVAGQAAPRRRQKQPHASRRQRTDGERRPETLRRPDNSDTPKEGKDGKERREGGRNH